MIETQKESMVFQEKQESSVFKLRRGALIGRSCLSDGPVVCPLFSNFQKQRFRESNAVLNVPGKHRTTCVQSTAADIPECTYVQSKSVQNKPSCAVEAVTSVYSRSNVLGYSHTMADSNQKHYVTVDVMQEIYMAITIPNTAVYTLFL